MTWQHIALVFIGATVACVGAFTPASAALIPLGTTIVGGALGHAGQTLLPKKEG
jgi:hypothetical protein